MWKIVTAIIFISLVFAEVAFCQMYEWIDSEGIKNFSNVAPPIEETVSVDSEVVSIEFYKPTIIKTQRSSSTSEKSSSKYKKNKIDRTEKKRLKIEASKGNLKKYWKNLYGKMEGRFEDGMTLESINLKRTIIMLSDSYTPYFIPLEYSGLTNRWKVGNRMSINRKDGILINKSNSASWIKIR